MMHNFFVFFILYMFRAAMCPSSGEFIVSMRHLEYVTLCRWPSCMQVGMKFHGVAFIQQILLMMDTYPPETCRE